MGPCHYQQSGTLIQILFLRNWQVRVLLVCSDISGFVNSEAGTPYQWILIRLDFLNRNARGDCCIFLCCIRHG